VVTKGWQLALGFLLWMRRWFFLPLLVTNVPVLVMNKGGDALSVCLNTVAILFMCDIDNICFNLALGERVRARVEDVGRVELGAAEASALARTTLVHVVLLVLSVCTLVLFPKEMAANAAVVCTMLVFPLGGVVDAFVQGASAAETAKRLGKVLRAWLLGLCVYLVLAMVTID
jgi:positive regulator of sigma E activity